MKTYEVFSEVFKSLVQLSYSHGLLKQYEVMEEGNVPDMAVQAIRVFTTEIDFKDFCTKNKIKYTDISVNITFEMFWERYGNKQEKIVAHKAWNKLSMTNRIKAYHYIPKYLRNIQMSGTAQKYPATYLNSGIYLEAA